jgi:hypothetical protein
MLGHHSGVDAEGGRVKVDQAPAQGTEAAAQPAQGADRAAEVDEKITALVRLLARQAAREHLHRLAHPDSEEPTDER